MTKSLKGLSWLSPQTFSSLTGAPVLCQVCAAATRISPLPPSFPPTVTMAMLILMPELLTTCVSKPFLNNPSAAPPKLNLNHLFPEMFFLTSGPQTAVGNQDLFFPRTYHSWNQINKLVLCQNLILSRVGTWHVCPMHEYRSRNMPTTRHVLKRCL